MADESDVETALVALVVSRPLSEWHKLAKCSGT